MKDAGPIYPSRPEGSLKHTLGSKISKGVGDLASRLGYSPEELFVNVSNRIANARRLEKRNRSFFGRIYNRMTSVQSEGLYRDA